MSIKTIDAKSMIIGFLLCAIGVISMGQTDLSNPTFFKEIYAERIILGSVSIDKEGIKISGTDEMDNLNHLAIKKDGFSIMNEKGSLSLTPQSLMIVDLQDSSSTNVDNSGFSLYKSGGFAVNISRGEMGGGLITLENGSGNQTSLIGGGEMGGTIILKNKKEEPAIVLGSNENGGAIFTITEGVNTAVGIETNEDGYGTITTYQKNALIPMNTIGSGAVSTYSSHGHPTGFLGTGDNEEGIIILLDESGNPGWYRKVSSK